MEFSVTFYNVSPVFKQSHTTHFLVVLMSLSGVPQGSCTGPLLFILYVDYLPDKRLTANTSVCLFTDVTEISAVFTDVSERPDMQDCLNEFVVWADRWQLQVAKHKCCVLTIGNITPITYQLKGVQLLLMNTEILV